VLTREHAFNHIVPPIDSVAEVHGPRRPVLPAGTPLAAIRTGRSRLSNPEVLVSMPSNVAEGFSRHSTAFYVQHLWTAHASGAELETQLEIGRRIEIVSQRCRKTHRGCSRGGSNHQWAGAITGTRANKSPGSERLTPESSRHQSLRRPWCLPPNPWCLRQP
jgi:hypothetical protein